MFNKKKHRPMSFSLYVVFMAISVSKPGIQISCTMSIIICLKSATECMS